MKSNIFFTFSIWVLLCLSLAKTHAQDTNSLDYYFDDNGISEARFIIKTNLFSVINGDLSIGIETPLSKRFSIEGGLGYQLPYYFSEPGYLLLDQKDFIDISPKNGYSILLQPKYYLLPNYPEMSYISLWYRRRHYNQKNGQSLQNIDLAVTWGVQFFIGAKAMIDFQYGFGLRHNKGLLDTSNSHPSKYTLAMPIALKIGYIL